MPSDGATLKLSEIFESLQGEGVSGVGAPTMFVRLAQCNNLHCTLVRHEIHLGLRGLQLRRRSARAARGGCRAHRQRADATRRLVLTGGEPLPQQKALAPFFASLAPDIVGRGRNQRDDQPDAGRRSRESTNGMSRQSSAMPAIPSLCALRPSGTALRLRDAARLVPEARRAERRRLRRSRRAREGTIVAARSRAVHAGSERPGSAARSGSARSGSCACARLSLFIAGYT